MRDQIRTSNNLASTHNIAKSMWKCYPSFRRRQADNFVKNVAKSYWASSNKLLFVRRAVLCGAVDWRALKSSDQKDYQTNTSLTSTNRKKQPQGFRTKERRDAEFLCWLLRNNFSESDSYYMVLMNDCCNSLDGAWNWFILNDNSGYSLIDFENWPIQTVLASHHGHFGGLFVCRLRLRNALEIYKSTIRVILSSVNL